MASPASADWGCMEVTAPFWATTSSLPGFHLVLNAIFLSLCPGFVLYNFVDYMKIDSNILIRILPKNPAPWQ
jgi:hypothetical protein